MIKVQKFNCWPYDHSMLFFRIKQSTFRSSCTIWHSHKKKKKKNACDPLSPRCCIWQCHHLLILVILIYMYWCFTVLIFISWRLLMLNFMCLFSICNYLANVSLNFLTWFFYYWVLRVFLYSRYKSVSAMWFTSFSS